MSAVFSNFNNNNIQSTPNQTLNLISPTTQKHYKWLCYRR